MKNIFKTFVAGAFIVAISTGVIIFGAAAVKGFASIASATGWVVVLHFLIGVACTTAAFYIAFSMGKAILGLKRYGGK